MKRFLIFILLFLSVFLNAHEVAFIYAGSDTDPTNMIEEKGWDLNYAALRWGGNRDDYSLSFNITNLNNVYMRVDIDQAWVRLPVYKELNIQLGCQTFDFSAGGKLGFC